MRGTLSAVAACFACLAALAGPAGAGAAGSGAAPRGDAILARSALAFRSAPALFATAHYVVRVPGAPVHEESQEFGRGAGVGPWIRMPAAYVMQVLHDRLYLVEEGRLEPHTEASLAAGLQAAIDSAFGGEGPPLAPAPLLLAEARTEAARRDAFRMKLLGPLRVAGTRSLAGRAGAAVDEVDLVAANGLVHARFDHRRGRLLGATLAFVTGPGADTIRAEASYVFHSAAPPPLPDAGRVRAGRRVSGLQELDGGTLAEPAALDPGARFLARDGARVGIAEPGERLVVLEFWASWCAPCRVAIPQIAEFARWAHDSAAGGRVVLVDTEESGSDMGALRQRIDRDLDRLAVRLPCWIDSGGVVHRRMASGLPLTLVLDPGGRVVRRYTGLHAGLADSLARLVRGRTPSSPR